MVNMYFGLRTASYFIASLFPVIMFVTILLTVHDIILAVMAALITAFLAAVLGRVMTGNPYIAMLEASGLLVLSLDSTGIVTPYVAKVDSKRLHLNTKKGFVSSVYDRAIGFYLRGGKKALFSDVKEQETKKDVLTGKVTVTGEKEFLEIRLPKEDFSKSYFNLMDKPMLFYNEKTETFLTKQALSDLENTILADYLSLVVLNKVQALGTQLTALTKVFSDYFKPVSILRMLDNPWVKGFVLIITIIGIAVVVIMFGPQIMEVLGQSDIVQEFAGRPITPIGG